MPKVIPDKKLGKITLTAQEKSIIRNYKQNQKQWRCDPCKQGKKCHCNKGPAFIENSKTKKRKYFCHTGCMLSHLPPKVFKDYLLSQM